MAEERLKVNPEFYNAVDQLILDAERVHGIVNGSGTQGVVVEDGSVIPTLRKAMIDNLYFKTPPFPWKPGGVVTVFNQLYTFAEPNLGASWWYAPGATTLAPVTMRTRPHDDPNWRLIIDTASIADIYAPLISPLFEGNPRGPTPAEDDDSNSLATTAFVVAAISAAIAPPGESNGSYYDLTIKNRTKTRRLEVTDTSSFTGQIDAATTGMLLNTLRLMGDDGKLEFSYNDPNFVGKYKTVIRPNTITTSKLDTDEIVSAKVSFGKSSSPSATEVVLSVNGNATIDYLRLKGNGSRPTSDPQLVVEGKAVIKDLQVTGTTTGLTVSVEGSDISPASVDTDQVTTRQLNVTERADIADLNISGTVTGITFPESNVDDKDISPRSVTTTADSNLGAKTTIKDLEVTGTVTGITADVSGDDITPRSVATEDYITVGSTLNVVGRSTLGETKISTSKLILGDDSVLDLSAIAAGSDGVGKVLSVAVGMANNARKFFQNPYPGYQIDVKVLINPLGSSTDFYQAGWGYAPDDKDTNKMKMFGTTGFRRKIASGADAGDWIVIQTAEGGVSHKPEFLGSANDNVNEALKNTGPMQIVVTRLFKDGTATPATPK